VLYTTVQKLMDYTSFEKLNILTQNIGLNRLVSWISKVYDEKDIKNINTGDMILIEKYNPELTANTFRVVIEACIEKHASAIIFSDYFRFSKDILAQIGEISRQHDIAIFQISSTMDERAFVRDIMIEIIKDKDMDYLDNMLLVDFLTKKRQEMGIAVERVESLGINPLSAYQIAVIGQAGNESGGLPESNQHVYKMLKNKVRQGNAHILSMHWNNMLIMALETNEEVEKSGGNSRLLEESYQYVRTQCEGLNLKIAIGRVYKPLTSIKASFDEALFAYNIYDIISKNSDSVLASYDGTGFYRILRGSHNVKEFMQFYTESMGCIEAYDKENNSDMIKTLELYLENNCNLDKTAEELFIHKNTLRYRILRIEEITGKKLKDFHVLSDYYICFKIKHYLGIVQD